MKIEDIRRQIDQVDGRLISMLEVRMDLVEQVLAYKQEHKGAVLDSGREQEVLEKAAQRVQNKAYETTIVAVMEQIIAQSRNFQEKEMEARDGKNQIL